MRVFCYREYEYENYALFFLDLAGLGMTLENKANILKSLDHLYGDTPQETTEWALEYELWCRMLLQDDALCLNPRHLDMDCSGDMPETLEQILSALPVGAAIKYMKGIMALPRIRELNQWMNTDWFDISDPQN